MKRAFGRGAAVLVLGLGMTSPALAETRFDVPELNVRVAPAAPYVQQQILQSVQLISAHRFEELALALPPVAGVQAITVVTPRVRKFRSYGVEGFVYETARVLFAESSGQLRLPAVKVSGVIARNQGGDETEQPFQRQAEDILLEISPRPAAHGDNWWLVANAVDVRQEWSSPPETLRVGDTVRRTILVTAEGVTGEHLPQLTHRQGRGLTQLPGSSERETELTPDGVVGYLKQSFDLRIDIENPIDFAPIAVAWWHAEAAAARTSVAPALRIEPLPRDVDGLVDKLMAEAELAHRSSRIGIVSIAVAAVALVILLAGWLALGKSKRRPEDRMLRRAAAETEAPTQVVAALLVWGRAVFPDERPMTLEVLSRRFDGDARVAIAALRIAAFGRRGEAGHAPPNGVGVAQAVISAAKRQRGPRVRPRLAKAVEHICGRQKQLPQFSDIVVGLNRQY